MQRLLLTTMAFILTTIPCAAAEDTFRLLSGSEGFLAASAIEEELWADASDGRLDGFSLLGAALVSSGIESPDELQQYEQKARKLLDELRSLTLTKTGPRKKVALSFAFLHRRVLCGRYDVSCGDLRRTLDEGRFNCLTASVLLSFFCEGLGIQYEILEMPGHAMLRVQLPEGPLELETTCPSWLEKIRPENPPFSQPTVDAGRWIAAVTSVEHTKARVVTPVQVAAMFYYNRGVELLSAGKYAKAAAANLKALRLDPQNTLARGNLLVTLNNWSIELGRQNRFAEAAELLREGLQLDSRHPVLTENLARLQHRWAEYCKGSGQDAGLITTYLNKKPTVPEPTSDQVLCTGGPKVD